MYFQRPDFWPELVEKAHNMDIFRGISMAVFQDNIVTIHRLIVLEHYARDVAKKYPYMSKEVMTFFWKYITELEKRKIDKDCSSLVINIAKQILELYRMMDY
jgi:hypothetical protein